MFGLVRLFLGCLLFGCLILVNKKVWVGEGNGKRVASIIGIIVFVTISAFVPLENAFLTFGSPESAYKYYNTFNPDVKMVVSGQYSDLVIGGKNDSDVYLIIPKTTDGWKIGIGVNTKRVSQKVVNGIVMCVYQYKNTTDYFVTVYDTQGGQSKISDVYGSEFASLERNNIALDKKYVTYYTHVPNIDSQYQVNINGEFIYVWGHGDRGQGDGSLVPSGR